MALSIGAACWEGRYCSIDARLYDPIPLLTAANGRKSMRLAELNGDGLITDPLTGKKFKSEWGGGARDAGVAEWPVSADPAVHVKGITDLFDSGVTIVNVHWGQPDQKRVVEFLRVGSAAEVKAERLDWSE